MFDAAALLALLETLEGAGYDFVAPTPATHHRFLAKRDRAREGNLRDIFGWNLPFTAPDPPLADLMGAAGILHHQGDDLFRSALRVSRLHGRLYLHSSFPTEDENSVFLGPDSYRFADFILREMPEQASRLVDVGGGTGVGAVVASSAAPQARLTMTDVNDQALFLADVNARYAGVVLKTVKADGLEGIDGGIDVVLANPPYMVDSEGRAYRDGGEGLGADISIEWTRQAVERLVTGGRLLLYSGSAIVDGEDQLKTALEAVPGASVRYAEIDPDVFGEELEQPPYAGVERIAAIGAVVTRL